MGERRVSVRFARRRGRLRPISLLPAPPLQLPLLNPPPPRVHSCLRPYNWRQLGPRGASHTSTHTTRTCTKNNAATAAVAPHVAAAVTALGVTKREREDMVCERVFGRSRGRKNARDGCCVFASPHFFVLSTKMGVEFGAADADLLGVGTVCAVGTCGVRDFLPFTCSACGVVTCGEHRSDHGCTVSTSARVLVCPVCAKAVKLPPGADPADETVAAAAFDAHARSQVSRGSRLAVAPRCAPPPSHPPHPSPIRRATPPTMPASTTNHAALRQGAGSGWGRPTR